MTDDQMDERLRAAGERWRAADTLAVERDAAGEIEMLPPRHPPHRPRGRWITAASAAVIAAALVVAGVLATRTGGNSPSANPERAGLTGITWMLSGAPGSTLRIGPDGTVTGNDGCNALAGTAKFTGDQISFEVGGTLMFCPGTSIAKTDQILSGTVTWSVTGDRLTLTKPRVGTLTYQHAGTGLVGPRWHLVKIVDRNGGTPPLDRQSTVQISTDGSLLANDGVNTLGARAQVHDATIVLGDVTSTAIGSTTASAVTAAVDAMLSGTIRYSISNGRLSLSKPGAGSLSYAVRQDDPDITDAAQLVGHQWQLTGVQATSGTGSDAAISNASAASVSTVVFDGRGGFTVQHRCYTDRGKAALGKGSAELTSVTLKSAIPCASNTESKAGQDENDLVDSVLAGNVTWSITGTDLTIGRGAHSLTFQRADPSGNGSAPSGTPGASAGGPGGGGSVASGTPSGTETLPNPVGSEVLPPSGTTS